MPTAYTGATYQQLTTGNRVNGTHWQLTVKCTGCTSFTGANGAVRLNPTGSNRFAFAYAAAKPSSPSSNTTSFTVHDGTTPPYEYPTLKNDAKLYSVQLLESRLLRWPESQLRQSCGQEWRYRFGMRTVRIRRILGTHIYNNSYKLLHMIMKYSSL
jgi:hypothetical protein